MKNTVDPKQLASSVNLDLQFSDEGIEKKICALWRKLLTIYFVNFCEGLIFRTLPWKIKWLYVSLEILIHTPTQKQMDPFCLEGRSVWLSVKYVDD